MSDDNEGGLSKITLSVEVGGHRYDMKMGDFSAMDEIEYKAVTGTDLMTPFATGQINSILIAGLVWRTRARYEKNLKFEKVAKQVKWGDLDTVKLIGVDDDEDDESLPEVSPGPEA